MHSRTKAFVDARRDDAIGPELIGCMRVPAAPFLNTGHIGPKANARGPNECLHVPYAKKLTACGAYGPAAHARQVS